MGLGISLQAANRLPDARDAFGRAKASNALSPELLAYVEQQLNQLR
jgi:MSHA biogenesis protein MshN